MNYRALGKVLDSYMQKFKDPNVEDFEGDLWKNNNVVNGQVQVANLKKKLSPRTKFIAITMGTQKIWKWVVALPL